MCYALLMTEGGSGSEMHTTTVPSASAMTSTSAINGSCLFFKLPTELRYQIYEYLFPTPHGVVCESMSYHATLEVQSVSFFRYFPLLCPIRDVYSTDFWSTEGDLSEAVVCSLAQANQLKFVSRQFNADTKGLTLSLNEVVFERGIKDFNDFASAAPSAVLNRLRTVTIMSSELCWDREPENEEASDAIHALIRFCKSHPHVLVRLRHAHLHPTEFPIFLQSVAYGLYLRGDETMVERVLIDLGERAIVMRHISFTMRISDRQIYPSNLRVYPLFAKLDEKSFNAYLRTFRTQAERGAVDLVKEIFEHGL